MHTLAGDGGVHSSLLYIVVFLLCVYSYFAVLVYIVVILQD